MASPFHVFRKNQKVMLALLGVMAMISFVFLAPLMDVIGVNSAGGDAQNPLVLTSKYGDLRRYDLERIKLQQSILNGFLNAAEQLSWTSQGSDPNRRPQMRSNNVDDEQAIALFLLSNKAEEMGFVVNDAAINYKLSQFKLTEKRLRELLQGYVYDGAPFTFGQLFEAYRTELLATLVQQAYGLDSNRIQPPAVYTPVQSFENFRRLNEQVQVESVEVPVEQFIDKVKEPTEAQVKEFFNKYQERFDVPTTRGGVVMETPEPGFRQPPKAQFHYLEANYLAFLDLAKEQVTDEEIAKYYEDHKREFEKVDLLQAPGEKENDLKLPGEKEIEAESTDKKDESKPADKSTETPDDTKPEAPPADDQKPAAPEEKKPADEKASEAPANEKPAEENPAEEKPADEPSDKPSGDEQSALPASDAPTSSVEILLGGVQPRVIYREEEEPLSAADDAGDVAGGEAGPEEDAAVEADQQPSAEKADDARPAEDTPADEQPSEEKTSGEEKPPVADEAPAEKSPPAAESKPADGEKEAAKDSSIPDIPDAIVPEKDVPAEEKKPEKPVEYKPLADVQDEIREKLAEQKAGFMIQAAMEPLKAELEKYWRRTTRQKLMDGKKDVAELPEGFLESAEKSGLVFKETLPLSFFQLDEIPLGKSPVQEESAFGAPLAQYAFSGRMELFQPVIAINDSGDQYLAWKARETEARIPELDEVRDEVIHAWKMIEARKLAEAEAKRLAEVARTAKLPLDKALGEEKVAVQFSTPFTWLTRGPLAQFSFQQPIRLSEITGVTGADDDFMKAIFSLQEGEVISLFNYPQTAAYVVRLAQRVTPEETLRADYLKEEQSPIFLRPWDMMARGRVQNQIVEALLEQVEKDADVVRFEDALAQTR